MNKQAFARSENQLTAALVERVLEKLGLPNRPSLDLRGLNQLRSDLREYSVR